MNNTIVALLIKWGMTFVAAWLTLRLFDTNPVTSVLLFSIVATALNYFVGDLYILPNFGNSIASMVDGLMAAGLAFIAAGIFAGFRSTGATLVAFAVVVAVAEFFFHKYLRSASKVKP